MFIILLFPVSVLAIPFNQTIRSKIVNPFWKLFSKIIFIFPLRAKVISIDRRKFKNFLPGLYILNHQSMIDIPLLACHFQISPIMKYELTKIPVFGFVTKISGAIIVNRKDPDSRKKTLIEAQKRLKLNMPIQYYPEGTRSKLGTPKPKEEVHRPLIDFCYKEKITVYPCSMFGTETILNKDGSINKNKNLGFISHQEIEPENYSDKDEFFNACWTKVIEGHNELKKILG